MGQAVVPPDDAADAERRQERRHDAQAEHARTADIAVHMAVMTDVVIAGHLADEQHDQEQNQPCEGNDYVDEHGGRAR